MRQRCKPSLAGICTALVPVFLGLSLAAAHGADATVRILGFGDSLMQGYGLPVGADFPSQLEAALNEAGLNVAVINAGVSGDTSAGGLARLDWSLADRPDAAIVELGGNDAMRGLPPEETARNLDAILAKLGEAGIPTLLAGILSPRNMGPDYVGEFDSLFPRLAEKHGVLFYRFFLDGVVLEPSLMQDATHANEEGVAVIVERIMPLAVDLVEQARARQTQ